jgi:hypothetical protein
LEESVLKFTTKAQRHYVEIYLIFTFSL